MTQHSQQSFFKVDHSIVSRTDLTPVQKLIYFYLLNLSGAPSSKRAGGAYPTNAAISEALGITVRQAKDNVIILNNIGILTSFKRSGQRFIMVENERNAIKILNNRLVRPAVPRTENAKARTENAKARTVSRINLVRSAV
jgi:hypothetical protein